MKTARRKKVFVAMSGGVDSSVAAALLKERGFDVIGVHMKCYNVDGCAVADAEDARRAAETLGIPFYVFDFEAEYKKRVVEYMIRGYREGITPNPDVMCNREIKFGLFLKKALEMGADYIATGHYIRLRKSEIRNPKPETISKSKILNPKRVLNLKNSRLEFVSNFDIRASSFSLQAAKDPGKDQSYFLWILTQKQLQHCLFPIGDYLKSEVRELARKSGLPNAEKKDSQGICFLGKVTLVDFLKEYIPEKRGLVLSTSGKVLGEHNGVHYYTAGQRHGLGVGGGKPLYVAEKDIRANTLVLAEGDNDPALYQKEIPLIKVNFINPITQSVNHLMTVYARVRYRQPLAKAELYKLRATGYKLIFDVPQKFVAAGQSAVFYTADGEMLGGGIIA